MSNSSPDLSNSTDEILTRLCQALSNGMDRFEARARGDRFTNYASLIEKHRDAVNKVIHGDARLRREMWK